MYFGQFPFLYTDGERESFWQTKEKDIYLFKDLWSNENWNQHY